MRDAASSTPKRSPRSVRRNATTACPCGGLHASDHHARLRVPGRDPAPPPRCPRPARRAERRASTDAKPLRVTLVVFTPSELERSIFPGAAITHSTPAACSALASANPVVPASYATRVGPPSQHKTPPPHSYGPPATARASPRLAVHRRRERLTRVHLQTQLRTFVMVGTSMIAVGARANPGPPTHAPHAGADLTPPADGENGRP